MEAVRKAAPQVLLSKTMSLRGLGKVSMGIGAVVAVMFGKEGEKVDGVLEGFAIDEERVVEDLIGKTLGQDVADKGS